MCCSFENISVQAIHNMMCHKNQKQLVWGVHILCFTPSDSLFSNHFSPPIRRNDLVFLPPNLSLLHLLTISVETGISGNLSSRPPPELKFPDIPVSTVILTSWKPPPFAIFSGACHGPVAQLRVNIPPYLEKFYIPPSFLNILPSAISNNTQQHGEQRRWERPTTASSK